VNESTKSIGNRYRIGNFVGSVSSKILVLVHHKFYSLLHYWYLESIVEHLSIRIA